MKVRMKLQNHTLFNGKPWPAPGETIDLPEGVALKEISQGRAEPVAEPAKKRTADSGPKEKRSGGAKKKTEAR